MSDPAVAAFGAALSSLIDDGTYDTLYRRWFRAAPGSSAHPYPPSGPPPRMLPRVTSGSILQRVLDRGELRVGFGLLGPPFSSEQQDGSVEGWDPELARALGRRLGELYGRPLRVESVCLPAVPFPDRLFDALDAGMVDALLSDLAVTPQRLQRVDFSPPYLCATFGILCADEAAARRLHSVAEVNSPAARLVILRRAFLNELADAHLPAATRIWVDDAVDILPALQQGRGDAALLPYASIRAFQEAWPQAACPELVVGPGAVRAVAWPKTEAPEGAA